MFLSKYESKVLIYRVPVKFTISRGPLNRRGHNVNDAQLSKIETALDFFSNSLYLQNLFLFQLMMPAPNFLIYILETMN